MAREPSKLEDEVGGLSMFVGEFVHSLDPKRRLTIPSVWRSQIGVPAGVIVMPDYTSPCLTVFPAGQMAHRYEALRQQAMSNERARKFMRMLGRSSELLPWDTQGRIRIKDWLLEFAGLEDSVTMIGAWDHIELWQAERLAADGEFDPVRMKELGEGVEF